MTTRRRFIRLAAVSGAGLAVARGATAQPALPLIDEKDPQAIALGYVHDTARADKAKYPKHAPDQRCDNCQLYQAKAGTTQGPCVLFPGKAVAAKGWCSAWAKKAG